MAVDVITMLGIRCVDHTPEPDCFTPQRLVRLLDADSRSVLDASGGVRLRAGHAPGAGEDG